MDEEAVPAAARLLRDFVNTYEPQTDTESLTSAAALQRWLAAHELVTHDVRLMEAHLARAVAVREGLRAVLLQHAGHEPEAGRLEALNAALTRVPVSLSFDAQDGLRLSGAGDDPGTVAFGGLLDAVRRSREDGSWPRLKVCARDSCRWAYHDGSRNQVRRWCSMAGCGNHVKMQRAYATRKGRSGGA